MARKTTVVLLLTLGLTAGWLISQAIAAPSDKGDEAENWENVFANIEKIEGFLGLVERMRDTCFDPAQAGIIAIGGIKDDVQREPEAITRDLEQLLKTTKTLGLRNSIRLQLKDLYKDMGQGEKALDQLRAMIAENDKAMQKRGHDDDDDDDDDD